MTEMTEEEQLAALHEWEDEGRETPPSDISDLAMLYLAQIKELQEHLQEEVIKIQKLEMAIKGFKISLQEELEKGLQPLFYCTSKSLGLSVKFIGMILIPYTFAYVEAIIVEPRVISL